MYKEQKRNKAIIIFLGLFFLFILNNVVYADFEWENIEHYKTSVKELSFLKDIWLKEDFLIYKQAKDSFLKKKYAKTILFCDKLIKKEYLPILDEIFYYMAFSYYHLKEYSKGLDIIKRISMDGLSDDLHFQFLDLQFDIYKKNKILNVLKKKLELKLQSKKIKDLKIKDLYNFFLAKIYENQYFLKEAFFHYIEALKLKTKAAEENFIKEVLLKIRYLYRSSYLNNFEKKELMNLIIDEFMKYDKFDLIESYNFIKRYTEDIPKNFF